MVVYIPLSAHFQNRKVLDMKVAAWSDGPNGKNEFGSGDDITSW